MRTNMKRVSVPADQTEQYAGKWVVIDPVKEQIIAVADRYEEIDSLVKTAPREKRPPGTVPFSFLVPRKGEGPYILWTLKI